ncbi:NUDIX domain-containing protein [Patescibacteria group bacterium]|nr:NUDIX domain-containing protein [Patescibacteria group bacterium]MBU0963528.1 NUDIX domain-containing protein [Patescibacteria group bacterium]
MSPENGGVPYDELISLLDQVDPGQRYSHEFFNALARISVSVAIEAVVVRVNPTNCQQEVLLIQRGPEETFPSLWHCPGTILRVGESIDTAMSRLADNEFKARILTFRFVDFYNNPDEGQRGHTMHLVFIVEVEDGSAGTWVPIDDLHEKDVIPYHRDSVIPLVLKSS